MTPRAHEYTREQLDIIRHLVSEEQKRRYRQLCQSHLESFLTCIWCNTPFPNGLTRKKYCSEQCRKNHFLSWHRKVF